MRALFVRKNKNRPPPPKRSFTFPPPVALLIPFMVISFAVQVLITLALWNFPRPTTIGRFGFPLVRGFFFRCRLDARALYVLTICSISWFGVFPGLRFHRCSQRTFWVDFANTFCLFNDAPSFGFMCMFDSPLFFRARTSGQLAAAGDYLSPYLLFAVLPSAAGKVTFNHFLNTMVSDPKSGQEWGSSFCLAFSFEKNVFTHFFQIRILRFQFLDISINEFPAPSALCFS